MAIHSWKRTIFTIIPGVPNPYTPAQEHTNILQIINRQSTGGGVVYVDDETNPYVSNTKYSVRIDPGTTGALIRPYSPKIVFFYTDSATALTISITEVITDDIHYFLGPTQYGVGATNATITQLASAGDTNLSSALVPANANYLYNGASWDAWRNNQGLTALTYAARTSTTSTSDFINLNHRGIILYFYIGAVSGTGSLTLSLEAKDPSGARYRQINTSYTARTAAGMTAHVLYPGASTAANNNNSDANVLPYIYRMTVTHADSSTYSYSLAYALIM